MLRLKFEANQDYQLEAIASITRLFEGLPPLYSQEAALEDEIVANLPPYQTLTEQWLLENLRMIQEGYNERAAQRGDLASRIEISGWDLEVDDGMMLEGVAVDSWRCPHFTVEMETGTGKTYVYLRTIYELRKQYGFRKFIIVVPSRAIYEGVVKSFEIMRSHFRGLYENENVNLFQYDSEQMSRIRSFATSTATDVLLITRDAFNKASNNIYKATEKLPGERKPYQYLQETRPIVILDEPQNMESERSKEALRTLKPLVVLRYSATHRSTPNLVYRLTPFEACRRGLVKRITVYGVTERDQMNEAGVELIKIEKQGGTWTATVRTLRSEKGQTHQAEVQVWQGEHLHNKTNRIEHFGWIVSNIHAGIGEVEFSNGERLRLGESTGMGREGIFRVQIRETIQRHMEQQERLYKRGIKVLSLFFIDRVANYTDEERPIIRMLFDEEFNELKRRYPLFREVEPEAVRTHYFAKKKVKNEEVYVDTPIEEAEKRSADIEAEKAAYQLIMKDKEQLLSLEEKKCFIFAHSALKEGWDNPNVFQICTLNQTVSTLRKRQEIGRGLRLCVDQSGARVLDDEVNILTVVPNESYRSFAENLQREYIEEGLAPPPRPSNAREDEVVRNEAIFRSKEFKAFWEKLRQRTRYRIQIKTEELVEECINRIDAATIPEPVTVVQRGEFVRTVYTLVLEGVTGGKARLKVWRVSRGEPEESWQFPAGEKTDLARILDDERLRGYKIARIVPDSDEPVVIFGNGERLTRAEPITFESEGGQRMRETEVQQEERRYPIFNLLERTAKETGITRPTINQIFKGLSEKKKGQFVRNPEGFANVFIGEIRNGLAEHVTKYLEFEVEETPADYDLEELFPVQKRFPQKELISAGENGIYDQVQRDSDEEENFVKWRLKDRPEVLFYFKFPPKFKIELPGIIGNYNPDWGIVWLNGKGKPVLELVRETKGTLDMERLRFPQEARKIEGARKHFRTIGIDYRPVTSRVINWWEPEGSKPIQEELM